MPTKYKYQTISKPSLEEINKLGSKGWRVVNYTIFESGYEEILLEKAENATEFEVREPIPYSKITTWDRDNPNKTRFNEK